MSRSHWLVLAVILVVILTSVTMWRCNNGGNAQDPQGGKPPTAEELKKWVPKVDPETRVILNLPFPKIVTRQALLGPPFDCAKKEEQATVTETTQPTEQSSTPSAYDCASKTAFLCSRVHLIELRVGSGIEGVKVEPESLEVQTGACVLWQVVSEDSDAATIKKIDFVDPTENVNGKRSSPIPLGIECVGTERCMLYVGLAKATYTYAAHVVHKGVEKIEDPDVVVDCDDCGDLICGGTGQ